MSRIVLRPAILKIILAHLVRQADTKAAAGSNEGCECQCECGWTCGGPFGGPDSRRRLLDLVERPFPERCEGVKVKGVKLFGLRKRTFSAGRATMTTCDHVGILTTTLNGALSSFFSLLLTTTTTATHSSAGRDLPPPTQHSHGTQDQPTRRHT